MSQTIVEKVAQAHMTEGPSRPLKAGDVIGLRPRHILTHDNTAAVMEKFRSIGADAIHDPKQPVFALDHDIQNTSEVNLTKYRNIKDFASTHGINFYPAGTGIGHQVMVSMGYVLPGSLVVASDSHANMYGALGALGTPVVRTDAAAVWATGEFWWQIPRSVQVVLEGELPKGATGKDVIIALCGLYNQGEVLNAVVEFTGPGVATLSMDARYSIANMTTEWGALAGWFPADQVTLAYLRRRKAHLEGLGVERIAEEDLLSWESSPPLPDPDATYAARIRLDLSRVSPHVSGPDSVQVMHSLAEMEEAGLPINKAYLVSCVNSRLEDLEAAAHVIRGRTVAEGVDLYVAAASAEIQEAAEASGAWGALVEAGASVLPPGCGPCIGLGTGLLEDGEVGISATNRNFKGRMGSRLAQAYLASPEVVVASAVAGRVMGPEALKEGRTQSRSRPTADYLEFETQDPGGEQVEILQGFPTALSGRLVFTPADNLNTDGIYSKDYTYREGMTEEEMAKVVMENYDPSFSEKTGAGDILVGGWNFGTGSSREQAATALKAKGIGLVLAGSFSQTYLRNAYNNGFVCIQCSALVKRLKEVFRTEVEDGTLTIVPGENLEVDFSNGTVSFRDEIFRFPPLGSVPQSLVVAGGSENLIRKKLGLDAPPFSKTLLEPFANPFGVKSTMARHTVVTMPGDGIGKVCLEESLRVLDAIGFEADYVHADIGWDFWIKEGNPLPERTIDLLREHGLGLFGAITSKPKWEADVELSPELRDKGLVYFSPIVGLRQVFNLDVCIRPCISFTGNPLNFIRRSADGGFEEPPVNVAVFRQNTEGLYAGLEWTDPPQNVYDALATHPKFKNWKAYDKSELAISTRVFSRTATRRIMKAAFEYAEKHGYKSVTVCEKPNVLRETSGMMEMVAQEVQKEHPSIQHWSTNIDAQMMWLTKNPEDYGVVVAGNMFGDIVSDAFAGLVGGLGFACSANIGDEVAVFEPTHGSAPKYEELDPPIVNPVAMILSAAMLLDHIEEFEMADRIRKAVGAVVAEGRVRTYDMMKMPGGPEAVAKGAATTFQVTDAIIEKLG